MPKSNLTFSEDGRRAWSYATCILDVLPDGRTIGNATKYSRTTSGHQREARVMDADVVVDGVPSGTLFLAAWYMDHLASAVARSVAGRRRRKP